MSWYINLYVFCTKINKTVWMIFQKAREKRSYWFAACEILWINYIISWETSIRNFDDTTVVVAVGLNVTEIAGFRWLQILFLFYFHFGLCSVKWMIRTNGLVGWIFTKWSLLSQTRRFFRVSKTLLIIPRSYIFVKNNIIYF